METKFNSQICTTIEQSERLLTLGLKKETADMCWTKVGTKSRTYYVPEIAPIKMVSWRHTPAWSLHRLIEIGFHKGIGIVVSENAYDSIISLIEKRIQNGVFNKEYLNNEN